MREPQKKRRKAARFVVGGRDVRTLVGEPVRVQTTEQSTLVGMPPVLDGVLLRVVGPLPSGKGAGIELRSLTKEKHRKPIFTTVPVAPHTKDNPVSMWRNDTVIKYRTVVKYRHTTLPLSAVRTLHPLLDNFNDLEGF